MKEKDDQISSANRRERSQFEKRRNGRNRLVKIRLV